MNFCRRRLACAVALALLAASLSSASPCLAGPAPARAQPRRIEQPQSPRRVARSLRARVGALTRTPASRSFQRDLSALVFSSQVTELARLAAASKGALSPFERAAVSLSLQIAKPGAQSLLHELESGRRPSKAQARRLARLFAAVYRNAATRALIREGRTLKSHPAKLHRAVRLLLQRLRPRVSRPAVSEIGSDPFSATDEALRRNARVLGAGSLAQAAVRLLAAPGAEAYLASLSPLALASLFPPGSASSSAARASDASASATPGCSDAQFQVLVDAVGGVAAELPATLKAEYTKRQVLKLIKSFLPDLGKAAQDLAGNPLTSILQTLGWSAAKAAYPAVRGAAIGCYADRIELVPSRQTIVAGSWKPFKLAILDESGHPILGGWIEDADTMSVDPSDDPTEDPRCEKVYSWECTAERAVEHTVRATLMGLETSGTLAVEPGPPVALGVSPASATIVVGEESPAYRGAGEDAFHNPTEAIVPGASTKDGVLAHIRMFPADGPCSDLTGRCTPGEPGPHNVVIERDDGVQNHATLEVLPGAPIMILPSDDTIDVSEVGWYQVWTRSADGDPLEDVSATATLAATGPGLCTQNVAGNWWCNWTAAGSYGLKATYQGAEAVASITVTNIFGP